MGVIPRTAGVAATQGIFLGLTWIFVLTRLYVRRSMVKRIDLDDYFLILTQVLFTLYSAVAFNALAHDFSRPVDYSNFLSSLHTISIGLHYWFLSEIFYLLTTVFLRVSVALLLQRIVSTPAQTRTIYTVMVLMVMASTAFGLTVILQCTPTSYYWTQWIGAKGHCVAGNVVGNVAYAHSAASFIADWVLGLLPIWLLWDVQISRQRKVGISALLGMGLLCGVSAIVRVPYLFRLDSTKDFTRDWVNIALCSIVEPGLGILAASFAAFRPLFLTKRFQSLYSGFLSTKKSWTKGSGWTGFSQKSGAASTMEEGKLGGIHKVTMVEIRRSSMHRNEESPVRKEAFETVELG